MNCVTIFLHNIWLLLLLLSVCVIVMGRDLPTVFVSAPKVSAKRHFNACLHRHFGTRPHIFEDFEHISKDKAMCEAHGSDGCGVECEVCPVDKTLFFMEAGFSCKNFSRLFHACSEGSRAEMLSSILEEGKGSTGATFQAMLKFIARHAPMFLLWENVKQLVEASSNVDVLIAGFQGVGYVVAWDYFNSKDFGISQDRVRVFGLSLNVKKSGLPWPEAHMLCQTILNLVKKMKSKECLPLHDFLLKHDDEFLEDIFTTKLAAKRPPYFTDEKQALFFVSLYEILCL